MNGLGKRAAFHFGPPLMEALARSWRVEVLNPELGRPLLTPGASFVLVSWHDALLPVLWYHRAQGIAAVVSEAQDGRYLARLAERLGFGVIPGSSTRGGRRALLGAIRALRAGTPVGLTPDGPRGPRREVKPGAVAAAAAGEVPILPVHAEARPAWRAGSWDRMLVPAPFANVRLAYGEPFLVGRGAEARAAAVTRLAQALNDAARVAAWPNGAATLTG
jgi:lysophospholipid acyltransferase (LPLAT)-like uncharacterized protein